MRSCRSPRHPATPDTDHLFIGAAATHLLPDLINVAAVFRADVVVRENLEYAGCVAAEALGLPHACVAAGPRPHSPARQRAAVVNHGGFNSVKEAMSRGVPMVVIPLDRYLRDSYRTSDRAYGWLFRARM